MTNDRRKLDTPVLVRLADVEPVPVRWLWPGRLPRGRLSLIAGMPGLGKSFATADFAARVSTGTPWPDGAACEQGSVLFVAAEDDPGDTVRPRLDALGADVSRVHMLTGVHRLDRHGKLVEGAFVLDDLKPLERALDDLNDVRLIIIDPIGSYMGGRVDAHRDTEVRAMLAPLAALASRADAAVLFVAHIRKGTATHADDLVLGSRAFTGLARSVLHLGQHPDDKALRVLVPGKNNLSAPPAGLAFTIAGDPPRVVWSSDPVNVTAADLLAGPSSGSSGGALDEAGEWLRDVLCNGPVPTAELKERAEADGLKWRTVERAKAALGVQAGRIDYDDSKPWAWWIKTG